MIIDYTSKPVYWNIVDGYLATVKSGDSKGTSRVYDCYEKVRNDLYVSKRKQEETK